MEVQQHSFLRRLFHSLVVIINTVNCTSDASRLKKEALCSSETSLPVLS